MNEKQLTIAYLKLILEAVIKNRKIEVIDISGLFKLLLNNYTEVFDKEIDIYLLETVKEEINKFISKIKN